MKRLFLIVFVACSAIVYGQKKNAAFQLHIQKAASAVTIDGIMNESAWQQADVAKNFFMVLPMDTSHARVATEIRMTYDNENIYVVAVCYLLKKTPYMVESLRRDFNFGKNDNFIFFMDPFNDLTNGFTFGANAAGAQWDGMLYEGGKADLNWDNKWISVVKNDDEKWVFEAAIPFKSIRYKKGITTWGINFSRLDISVAEKSAWAPVPRQFPTASLAYTGNLIWDAAPPEAGANFAVIPYALGGVSKAYDKEDKAAYRKDIGADAKIGLSSSLNLDLTVNPDFSQVEVDKQVTNLDRFELFFPERRQFFLENNDLFANFGYANVRPFFSRRIGLGVPINFGARLSGSLNKNWRIGLMDMQTKHVDETGLPAQNFAVLALQRRVFARSNIRFMFVNKQSVNYDPGKDTTKPLYSRYNRNIGVEYNLASANNLWNGKAMLMKSFSPGKADKDFTHAANLQYASRHWLVAWQHEIVGKNFNAEVGYVPRRDYVKVNPSVAYLFFPKTYGKILSHGPKITSTVFFNGSFGHTDDETILQYIFNKRDQTVFDVWAGNSYVKLLQPFDPTNSNKDTLATGTQHRWNAWGLDYFSRPQQLLTYNLSARFGGYYAEGTRANLIADIGYRFQPYASIALSASYNHIKMPAPWNITDFWLIGPRIDITFTNKLFFTTFVQYNNQQQNINLNTRLQWRYRPASDLFLVYTDNYYPAPLSVRNRAFVLKFTYWWNS
ncbi:carbohydrate binding family 9 domain-containing protein [Panacibacter sp. DH6]|uniref:Carbohydrate binding family 9 domain-containing protein n=1 Tax=Panacibacter microcysteis TaxID=2793269 RepID=A0A931GUD1_9BACT|nr:carbohydrate binding family 9 domain-containing protein [Panacibacter microcysteis]MBG9376541.1 carbohydrate binding family 9 domain-containing protein [Panacibacter microcysteis]